VAGSDIEFEQFVRDVEPRLRRALVARYGPDAGREATIDALAWAWEHKGRLRELSNPSGYLYRIGQSRSRQRLSPVLFERPVTEDPWSEPKLAAAIAALPERQRVAVFLVHGAGWTQAEVAEMLGIRPATVQKHVDRGLAKLRATIAGGEQ
jgi:DNA-directed RNA polymerase specialized sigma24 family protein